MGTCRVRWDIWKRYVDLSYLRLGGAGVDCGEGHHRQRNDEHACKQA